MSIKTDLKMNNISQIFAIGDIHGCKNLLEKIHNKILKKSEKVEGNKILIYLKDFIFHRLQVFLIQYTYTANTLKTINRLYAKFTKKKSVVIREPNFGYSYFFDDHEAINDALYFSKKLLSEASGLKRRIIVIFPEVVCVNSICRSKNLEMIYNGKDYKNLKWYLDFKKIASETNSTLLDLADYIEKDDIQKMVVKCDGHPNPYGIRVIVELIVEKFFSKLNS